MVEFAMGFPEHVRCAVPLLVIVAILAVILYIAANKES